MLGCFALSFLSSSNSICRWLSGSLLKLSVLLFLVSILLDDAVFVVVTSVTVDSVVGFVTVSKVLLSSPTMPVSLPIVVELLGVGVPSFDLSIVTK